MRKKQPKGLLLIGAQKAVWEPVKIKDHDMLSDMFCNAIIGMIDSINFSRWIEAKHKVGERVYLKEPWFWWLDHYVYWDSVQSSSVPTGMWQKAAKMPMSAARTWYECVSVVAVRVNDVSNEQLIAMGYTNYFATQLDTLKFQQDIINAGYTWAQNPFIFISTFKQVEP